MMNKFQNDEQRHTRGLPDGVRAVDEAQAQQMCRPIYHRVRCRQLHGITAQTRTAVKSIRRRGHLCRGHSATFERDGKTGLHGAELQQLDLHAAAHGWPLDGQNISMGRCIAHGVLSGTTGRSPIHCADDDAHHKEGVNMSVRPVMLRSIRA